MEHVTVLAVRETARVDSDQLRYLGTQLGPTVAEDVICRAVDELATRIGLAERCLSAQAHQDLRRHARSLIAIADQIGMEGVAHVARDVVHCVDEGDRIALAATVARLLRMGESSINALWDIQGDRI